MPYSMRSLLHAFSLFVMCCWAQAGTSGEIHSAVLDIPLQDMSGAEQTLSKMSAGKPVYLKLWASWCKPCMQQMPHFQSVQNRYGERVQVISVNIDVNDDLEDVKKVQQRFGLTMPTLFDTTGRFAQGVNLLGTPYHLLLSKDGKVIFSGHEASEELDRAIAAVAKGEVSEVPAVVEEGSKATVAVPEKGLTALFFSATWCDWYLADTRPQIAQNCDRANRMLQSLTAEFPQLQWQAMYSRLWTGPNDLQEYLTKYALKVPAAIDADNRLSLQYQIKDYPTLVIVKEGREVGRVEQFESVEKVKEQLKSML